MLPLHTTFPLLIYVSKGTEKTYVDKWKDILDRPVFEGWIKIFNIPLADLFKEERDTASTQSGSPEQPKAISIELENKLRLLGSSGLHKFAEEISYQEAWNFSQAS